jgi:hypothetical protein
MIEATGDNRIRKMMMSLYPPHAANRTMDHSDSRSGSFERPACPKCGAQMWLAVLQPDPAPGRHGDHLQYDCACGHRLTMTVDRARTGVRSNVVAFPAAARPRRDGDD